MIMVACWGIALPFGYILGLTDWLVEPMGPHGLWVGLVTALTLAATFLALRLNAISKRYINDRPDMAGQTVAMAH